MSDQQHERPVNINEGHDATMGAASNTAMAHNSERPAEGISLIFIDSCEDRVAVVFCCRFVAERVSIGFEAGLATPMAVNASSYISPYSAQTSPAVDHIR
jgi:hypothetical protein